MYLDIYVATLLPFDFMTTATAVWNHYRGIGRRRGSLNQNSTLDDESDTVIEEVAVKFTGKSTNADFRVKQAIQRHMEPDRQVVVWVSKAEAVEQQMSAYSKFALVDKGYVVVKRPALLEQGQTPSTLLQICCLISPQMTRGCVLDVKSAGVYTEFVLSVMVASISATRGLIENILPKEARQLFNIETKRTLSTRMNVFRMSYVGHGVKAIKISWNIPWPNAHQKSTIMPDRKSVV